MLPASTGERKARDISRGKQDGRGVEIQRLIGRSLRVVVDFEELGERSVYVDCDVLRPTGHPLRGDHRRLRGAAPGAAEAGRRGGDRGDAADRLGRRGQRRHGRRAGALRPRLLRGLGAEVDANVVMTGEGGLVEVQATAERTPALARLAGRAAGARRGGHRPPPRGPGAGSGAANLILATGNEHKLRELREMLPGVELEPLPDDVALPPEDGGLVCGDRAEEGAGDARGDREGGDRRRLRDRGRRPGRRPGIHSARYGGEGASDEENLEKLLREVAAAGDDRRASYACALALIDGGRRASTSSRRAGTGT